MKQSGQRSVSFILASLLVLAPACAWSTVKDQFSTINKFNQSNGEQPNSSLIADAQGNLYGTTDEGGLSDGGVVFELSPTASGWTETVLYSFCAVSGCADGGRPTGLVFDSLGNLYGVTGGGGAHGYGTVYQLTPSSGGEWQETVLHTFSGPDGASPNGTLIFDSSGNLSGTTLGGGEHGSGTVFQLTSVSGTWKETLIYSFCAAANCTDGSSPQGGVILDQSGSLYGATRSGGDSTCYNGYNYGCGVVFRLSGAGSKWRETVLHAFASNNEGIAPQAGVTFDASGNLFGTTYGGGAFGYGVVFELIPATEDNWTEKVVHAFKFKTGANPSAGIIFDSSGNLYGAALYGGITNKVCPQGCGVVFEITTVSGKWKEDVIRFFSGIASGYGPAYGLTMDANGNLFGTTVWGDGYCPAANGCGTVYELSPLSSDQRP
jgi:uncharacterized repeat protein (TIGR03803 family)